jgi:glycosyltransferase involved in cell wall biosynthesis
MVAPCRVLHVIDHLGPGGAQEVVGHLLRYGNRERFQPEVAVLHGFGHYYHLFRSWGVPVYPLVPHGWGAPAVPLIALRLRRLLSRRRYQVVHTHLMASQLLATPLAALCGVPVRLSHDHTHDDLRGRVPLLCLLDRLANRLNHGIIAGSFSIREFLVRQEKVPPAKIAVIYSGVDLAGFPPADQAFRERARRDLSLPPEALVVGGVGRLHYQKNFPLFLRVAAEVAGSLPQVRFLIAGEGPERDALEALARTLGLAAHVHFLGFVKDMPGFYGALDVLLFTSRFEGTCLATLEALAVGVPVVASRVDGIAELLSDGSEALLVAPGDLPGFARGVTRLLTQRDLARRLARNGRDKVRRQVSAAAMVQQVESFYLSLMGKRVGDGQGPAAPAPRRP